MRRAAFPEKAIGVLIDAFTRLKESRNGAGDLHLLIVGDGPERDTLQAQIEAHGMAGSIRLSGARDDVPRLLGAGDIFCLPSRQEGLGLAVIEAMAAGLPVVATNVGGIPEVVQADETGILVPPNDAEAIAKAIATLRDDTIRARSMGMKGQERARRHFDAPTMVGATRDVYAKALSR